MKVCRITQNWLKLLSISTFTFHFFQKLDLNVLYWLPTTTNRSTVIIYVFCWMSMQYCLPFIEKWTVESWEKGTFLWNMHIFCPYFFIINIKNAVGWCIPTWNDNLWCVLLVMLVCYQLNHIFCRYWRSCFECWRYLILPQQSEASKKLLCWLKWVYFGMLLTISGVLV